MLPPIPPANVYDVMQEQLDYLIEHVQAGPCYGCEACSRFLGVKALLCEAVFDRAMETGA